MQLAGAGNRFPKTPFSPLLIVFPIVYFLYHSFVQRMTIRKGKLRETGGPLNHIGFRAVNRVGFTGKVTGLRVKTYDRRTVNADNVKKLTY